MQHHWYDTVAVLSVEGYVVPAYVDREKAVVVASVVEERGLGAGQVGGQRAQMGFAVPAMDVLDLIFEGLIIAHPSAVALRVGGLEADVRPVVETDGELEGFAVEMLYRQVCPLWVQDIYYRVTLQNPVGIRKVFPEELLHLEYGVEDPRDVTDSDHLSLVFLLAEDHVEDGLVAVVVNLFAPSAAIVVRFRVVTQLFHDCFSAGEERSHISDRPHDETRIQELLAGGRPRVWTGRNRIVGVAVKQILG